MSEFRRSLMMIEDNSGGCWYRICPDGIYTTTNAYIDTGYKNFTNRYFEFWVDCKVLSTKNYSRALTGAVTNNYSLYGDATYNQISFGSTSMSVSILNNSFYGAHCNRNGQTTTISSHKPYINKKVRVKQPVNQNGYYFSVQFWEDDVLGTPIYSNGETTERQDYVNETSMYIFACNYNFSIRDGQVADNIVIYASEARQRNVPVYSMTACQLTRNITVDLAWDNKPHSKGEYGMYDEVSGKFFGNANSTGYFIENFD